MDSFIMNGILWRVRFVNSRSPYLFDRTSNQRLATTDPKTRTVYISSELHGDFLTTVLLHELGHCVMFSYHLLDYIHSRVYPEYWIEAEEWICNFIADYGRKIFKVASRILGVENVWEIIPYELEKIIA